MRSEKVIANVYIALNASFTKGDDAVADFIMHNFSWNKKGTLTKIKDTLRRALENNGRIIWYSPSSGDEYVCRILDIDSLKRTFYLIERFTLLEKAKDE